LTFTLMWSYIIKKNGGGTTISFYNYFWQLLPDMTVLESSDSNAELLLVPQYYIFMQLTGKVSFLHLFLKLEFLCTCVLVSKSGKFAKIYYPIFFIQD